MVAVLAALETRMPSAEAQSACTGRPGIGPIQRELFCRGSEQWVRISELLIRADGSTCTRVLESPVTGATCSNPSGTGGGDTYSVLNQTVMLGQYAPPWDDDRPTLPSFDEAVITSLIRGLLRGGGDSGGGTTAGDPDAADENATTPDGGGVDMRDRRRELIEAWQAQIRELKEKQRAARQDLADGNAALQDAEAAIAAHEDRMREAGIDPNDPEAFYSDRSTEIHSITVQIEARQEELRGPVSSERREELKSEIADLQQSWSDVSDRYGDASAMASQLDQLVDARNGAQSSIYSAQATIDNIDREIDVAETNILQLHAQNAQNQVKAGMPPDAGPLDRLKNVRWWTDGTVSGVDERGGRNVEGALGRLMAGGDITIAERLAIGFGFGVLTSDLNTVGGSVKSDGVIGLIRGFWGPTETVWFDIAATYGAHSVVDTTGGVRDSFAVDQYGFGGGVNIAHNFDQRWRVDGRLGWFGSWSRRAASINSAGAAVAANTAAFGQAVASAKLTRRSAHGALFADAALRAVTHDTSAGNFDANPVDGELGGGFHLDLAEGLALTGRGYAVIGRGNYEEFGGVLRVEGYF